MSAIREPQYNAEQVGRAAMRAMVALRREKKRPPTIWDLDDALPFPTEVVIRGIRDNIVNADNTAGIFKLQIWWFSVAPLQPGALRERLTEAAKIKY